MKKCCLFNSDETKFKELKDFEEIKNYGEIDSPNECKRKLKKCNKCGALFLFQFLEWNDSCYDDFIQVENEKEADELNSILKFNNFSSSKNPMIKIGSDNITHFILPKSMLRAKQIIEALENKDQNKLKELNVSNEEVESILRSIDKKIEKLDFKILEYISNVEQEINYTFVDEYKDYLVNASTLKLEKNILGLSNGNEKLIRYLYSMDPNSKTYILKFQSFDSELKDKLVPFAELEFGDTLCFERETNKIVLYNHELDTSTTIADNWNNFIKELYNDDVYKIKNGFEYKYKGMEVIITSEEINEELTNYADKIVDFYFESKDKITDFLFQKFEKDEWYIKEYTKEQILEKIGKPTIYVDEVDYGSLCYLKSKLDEHLITIELYGLNLDSVSIDG